MTRAEVAVTNRTAPSPAALPRRAHWWKVFPVWARQEFLLLAREPVAVFFSLAFPLVIYVFIGIPYGDREIAPGVRFVDVMFPALVMTVVANLLLMGLPIYLAELRSRGADRRYAILPLPGGVFAAAVLSATLTLVLAAAAVITTIVAVRDGLRPTAVTSVFPLLVAGCVLWLASLGFLLGSLRLSSRTTQALSALVFFTLFFGSGAAVPLEGLPSVLQQILEWNPLKQWLDVMVNVYTGLETTTTEWLRLLLALPLTLASGALGLALWRRH